MSFTSPDLQKATYTELAPVDTCAHAYAEELDPDDKNAFTACGKAIDYLMKAERDGSIGLEKKSIYGAAVAIPQIARSSGWSGTLSALALRSYIFLFLNIFLQGFLLCLIGEESNIMWPYSGRMHLCDYGFNIPKCPDAPNCRGPGGTSLSFPRLYSFGTWNTRIFVRDSLKVMFPSRKDDIHEIADPGEYGLEDYYCRLVCCFIFAMAVMDDLNATLSFPRLLYHVPTRDEKWIRFTVPEWDDKENAKLMFGWNELDLVKFGVAGLPLHWKVINIVCIFLPKLCIWIVLVSCGFHFLMETSGIVDVIMNSMALTFILNIDEMIFEVLTTVPVRHIMEKIEDYQLFSIDALEEEDEEECIARYRREQLGYNRFWSCLRVVIPRRLIMVILVVSIFLIKYYANNCERTKDGSWISKPMFAPNSNFNLIELLVPQPGPMEGERPFWTMPEN